LKAGPIEPEASRGAVGVEHGVSGDNNVASNIYDHVTFLHVRNVPSWNGGINPALQRNTGYLRSTTNDSCPTAQISKRIQHHGDFYLQPETALKGCFLFGIKSGIIKETFVKLSNDR